MHNDVRINLLFEIDIAVPVVKESCCRSVAHIHILKVVPHVVRVHQEMQAKLVTECWQVSRTQFLKGLLKTKIQTYPSRAFINADLPEPLEESVIVIVVLLVDLLLPENGYVFLEIGLHSPVRPIVLARVLGVLVQEFSSVHCVLAAL